jgi:hypothetical protein
MHLTLLLFVSAAVVYVALSVPTLLHVDPPLIDSCHWYDAVPPLVMLAVNVVDTPAQMLVPGLAPIDIVAATDVVTAVVIILDVAGLPVAHDAILVSVHLIMSPLPAARRYVGEFVPTLLYEPPPFVDRCHWYIGVVPPFVGVAVYVTTCPEHTLPGLCAIVTLTGCVAVTFTTVASDTDERHPFWLTRTV